MIQVILLFICPRTFPLKQIKQEFKKLSIYFTSRNITIYAPKPEVYVSQSILIAALALLAIMVTTPILPLAAE